MKFGKFNFDTKTLGTIGMCVTMIGTLLGLIGDSLQSKAADDHIREIAQEVMKSQK